MVRLPSHASSRSRQAARLTLLLLLAACQAWIWFTPGGARCAQNQDTLHLFVTQGERYGDALVRIEQGDWQSVETAAAQFAQHAAWRRIQLHVAGGVQQQHMQSLRQAIVAAAGTAPELVIVRDNSRPHEDTSSGGPAVRGTQEAAP